MQDEGLGSVTKVYWFHSDLFDELFLHNDWPAKSTYSFFPGGTIAWDSHHRKSSARRK